MDINVIAPINQLGYGIVGLNIVKALSKRHTVALWIIGQGEAHPNEHTLIKHCSENNNLFFNAKAPSLRIWHQHDMAIRIGNGLNAGLPIFELNKFTSLEKHHLESLQHILLPSKWAEYIVKENGINTKTTVVPFGVDTSLFHPRPEIKLTSTSTNFLNIGKWEVRKGHDILVEAFNKAFEPSDNVNLIMNCFNPFLLNKDSDGNDTWTALYKNSKLGNKITVIPKRLETQVDVANLMNAVDCGVFPSRAEGWNLELLEMMACGKQVIATDYAAHQEFCNNHNCALIPIDGLEPAYDGIWFKGQGEWVELGDNQIDYLVEAMRRVHNVKQAGGDLYNEAGVKTAEKFTWLATADKIMETLYERNRTEGAKSC